MFCFITQEGRTRECFSDDGFSGETKRGKGEEKGQNTRERVEEKRDSSVLLIHVLILSMAIGERKRDV